MIERRGIVELARAGTAEVLVTLVRVEGSSYRRPGARLLLAAGGGYAGTLSGGCLETEVARKALWLSRNGPVVERYSTLFDDTSDIPFGLGCGGTVHLLYERTDTPEAAALLLALERSLSGARSTVLTWLPSPGVPLRRAILDEASQPLFVSAGLTPAMLADCAFGRDVPHGEPGEAIFRERLEPPQRLILLGAGDDARPVAAMAALVGWTVQVADGRGQLARAERFPEAHAVHALRDASELAGVLSLRAADAIVLMTHSYEQDRALLAALLTAPVSPRYIGILGARHRTSLLVAEVAALTGQTIAACCQRIHAPVGLKLGGDGPEAIALAVVAEVQAFCQGALPATPRLTPDDVAFQLSQGGVSRYLQAQCALEAAS